MWVPWVVEGLKVIMAYFILEYVYGNNDELNPEWILSGYCEVDQC